MAAWPPMLDDDGSGTTGTIANKALFDGVKAYIDTSGTWTTVDLSGAGLTFLSVTAKYAKVGPLVGIMAELTFPTTSNASPVTIGSLPFVNRGPSGGFYQNQIQTVAFFLGANQSAFNLMDRTTGALKTNVQMSGANLNFAGVYLTDP